MLDINRKFNGRKFEKKNSFKLTSDDLFSKILMSKHQCLNGLSHFTNKSDNFFEKCVHARMNEYMAEPIKRMANTTEIKATTTNLFACNSKM